MPKSKTKVFDLTLEEGGEARMPRATKTTVKILEAFLERPTEERHGFRLFEETGIKSGSGYPILLRFEKLGWFSSRWEESDEPGPRGARDQAAQRPRGRDRSLLHP